MIPYLAKYDTIFRGLCFSGRCLVFLAVEWWACSVVLHLLSDVPVEVDVVMFGDGFDKTYESDAGIVLTSVFEYRADAS